MNLQLALDKEKVKITVASCKRLRENLRTWIENGRLTKELVTLDRILSNMNPQINWKASILKSLLEIISGHVFGFYIINPAKYKYKNKITEILSISTFLLCSKLSKIEIYSPEDKRNPTIIVWLEDRRSFVENIYNELYSLTKKGVKINSGNIEIKGNFMVYALLHEVTQGILHYKGELDFIDKIKINHGKLKEVEGGIKTVLKDLITEYVINLFLKEENKQRMYYFSSINLQISKLVKPAKSKKFYNDVIIYLCSIFSKEVYKGKLSKEVKRELNRIATSIKNEAKELHSKYKQVMSQIYNFAIKHENYFI